MFRVTVDAQIQSPGDLMKKRDLPRTSQPLLSRWLYVLVGQNDSGKTSFQRHLIDFLCDKNYDRLPRDGVFHVTHPRAPRNFATIACANRSYQERRKENGTVENYMLNVIQEADVTVVASHSGSSDLVDIKDMLKYGHRRGCNVAAVFLENAQSTLTSDISELGWDDRLLLRNPIVREGQGMEDRIQEQLRLAAVQFGDLLIARTCSC